MDILGYNYTIISDKDRNDMEAWGIANHKSLKIFLATDLGDQQLLSTLLHEILESIKFHLDITLEHDDLNRLEAGLFQILGKNGVDLTPLLKEINNGEHSV